MLDLVKAELELFADKDPSRIILGGLSQGCMSVLAAMIVSDLGKPLGGVFGLSGPQSLTLDGVTDE